MVFEVPNIRLSTAMASSDPAARAKRWCYEWQRGPVGEKVLRPACCPFGAGSVANYFEQLHPVLEQARGLGSDVMRPEHSRKFGVAEIWALV